MAGTSVTADPGVPDELVAWLRWLADVYASHDAQRIVTELFNEDAVYEDHRPMFAVVATGYDELRPYLETTFELVPDFAISIHVLDARGDVYLARDTYEGHSVEGGGSAVIEWWVVDRLRDGRLAREDVFETEAEARAAYEAATGT